MKKGQENMRFAIKQNRKVIKKTSLLMMAVSEAKAEAVRTGQDVQVAVEADSGAVCEATFHPDGTNENIWALDRGEKFTPTVGETYLNRGGGSFRCISVKAPGATYYNRADGQSDAVAEFQNIQSGWTFVAKGIIRYIDGTIEWDHSVDGHFASLTDIKA